MKRFVSWNVNGFRACLQKGFDAVFQAQDADFFCLQETKMQPGQADYAPEGYYSYFHSAEKKGYSGTAVFAKEVPLAIAYGLNGAHTEEGRVISLEYPGFHLVTCYSPNAQEGLKRIDYRMAFEDDLRAYLVSLAEQKPVVLCGDLNVAHEEIDLKNPGPNRGSAGFSDQEREKFSTLIAAGFVDTFRYLYPAATGAYSWWSYRFNARKNNAGWRIDYFVVSKGLAPYIKEAGMEAEIMGSDHCPVYLTLDI